MYGESPLKKGPDGKWYDPDLPPPPDPDWAGGPGWNPEARMDTFMAGFGCGCATVILLVLAALWMALML
jgi:hypothetical protein